MLHQATTTPPVPLALGDLAPFPSLFTHRSTLHGQSHVARVMVHAFSMIEATGWREEPHACGRRCTCMTLRAHTMAAAVATAPTP